MYIPDFSCVDHTFPKLDFETSLKMFKLLSFDKIDVVLNEYAGNRHLHTFQELDHPMENGKILAEKLSGEGFVPTDLFIFLGDHEKWAINSPNRERRLVNADYFKKAVTYAKACGSGHITIVPGVVFDNDYGESLKRAAQELKWRAGYGEEHGIVVSFEPHIGSIADTTERTLELLERAGSATVTLDYSHFIKNGEEQEEIDRLLPFAAHMHFRNACSGSSQTIFDESCIDYQKMLHLIKRKGYSGEMAIEFCSSPWENQNRVDTIGETVSLREHLLKLWKETER